MTWFSVMGHGIFWVSQRPLTETKHGLLQVVWLKNEERLKLDLVHKYRVVGNGTELSIDNIDYADTGAYMCQASNTGGVTRDISSLIVQEVLTPSECPVVHRIIRVARRSEKQLQSRIMCSINYNKKNKMFVEFWREIRKSKFTRKIASCLWRGWGWRVDDKFSRWNIRNAYNTCS